MTGSQATTVRFAGTVIAATLAIIFHTSTAAIANVDESASPILDALISHKGTESVTCTKVYLEGVSTMAGHLGGFVVTFPAVFMILLWLMAWDNRTVIRTVLYVKNKTFARYTENPSKNKI